MIKKFLLSLTLIGILSFILSCKKKEPETVIVVQERGYVCENYTCKFVETGADYLSLVDCKSECADKRPGNMRIKTNFGVNYYSDYTVTINYAYTAEDVAIGAYFDEKSEPGSNYENQYVQKSFDYTKTGLPPANYYYHIVLYRKNNSLPIAQKSGLVTVKPNETAFAEVNFD